MNEPYSRVYWTVVDDPKFATIYDDDHHFATWVRLLMIADQAHPASAHLPGSARFASVKELTRVRLIDVSGSRYRIHGMDPERAKRSERGRNAANARWNADASDDAMQPVSQTDARRDETRRDEHRRDETSNAREPHIEAWLMVRQRLPTQRQRDFLDRYLQVFDQTGPDRMAALILRHPDDPIAALKEDLDAFREQRLGELANGNPVSKPKAKREPWQEQFRELMAAKEADILAAAPIPADES